MIVYLTDMRVKDDDKQEALFEATVKLVNEVGFAASSVSKIAREAQVSPATIYVYFKNKEDLLVSAYVEIKRNISEAVLKDFDENLQIKEIFKKVWFNMFEYTLTHQNYFYFTEQFSNSPYYMLVDKKKVEKYFAPILQVMQRGIEQKIIKNVDFDILAAFIFYPIVMLSNSRRCQNVEMNIDNIEIAFTLAWDAIRV